MCVGILSRELLPQHLESSIGLTDTHTWAQTAKDLKIVRSTIVQLTR